MAHPTLMIYTFYCVDNGDNMSARVYAIRNGSVIRYCYVRGCGARIRQRIPREQAAREMNDLRHSARILRKVYP